MTFSRIVSDPVLFIAFGFGSGLLPKAPGTFGTLCAIPIFIMIGGLGMLHYITIVCVMAFCGIWICDNATKKLGVHDHPGIVWDEIVGLLVTMVAGSVSFASIAMGFLLFRLFDIVKPWPIGRIDKELEGGLGIMLDDVLAGVYAALCLAFVSKVIA